MGCKDVRITKKNVKRVLERCLFVRDLLLSVALYLDWGL